ncbi:MAG: DnaJ-class molecular chaperone with C-terminal Zn finger domain protein [Halonotius sp. J07HN4]|nr:MAG: DnaJ-class molecular chaperone with C-terminal Zn finger domain protein [Halonotius sp. J07HN4]
MSDSYGGTPSAASYYERLGVDPDADDDELRRASKLAKRAVHPDNNSNEQAAAEREFDRVTDAADALTDSDLRAAYDTFIDDQGPKTGTDRYEEWDTAGRPKSPTAWLSEPRSGSSSTTTSAAGGSTAETGTGSTTRSTTGSATGDTTSRAGERRDRHRSGRNRPGEKTQRSTATQGGERADGDNRTEAASTADSTGTSSTAETTGASAASTTPTGRPNTERAPASVLGEDPEELYGKYVLDSEAAWKSDDAGQSVSDGGTTGASVPVAAAIIARVAPSRVADSIRGFVAIPKPWWVQVGVAAVLLASAVVVGPIAEGLVLLPFVFLPRIGPWLYPTLAVAVTAPLRVPLDTSAILLAAYAGLAIGYALLNYRRRLIGT